MNRIVSSDYVVKVVDDAALLVNVLYRLLTDDLMYVQLDRSDQGTRDGSFLLTVDGTTWNLTPEERDAVERLLTAKGRGLDGQSVPLSPDSETAE